MVVFTSDHGDMMLSQGLTTKQYPWDESIACRSCCGTRAVRVADRRITTLLNTPDILPMLLSLAEIPIPIRSKDGGVDQRRC
jgi:arylsulfatase A-like enzyme